MNTLGIEANALALGETMQVYCPFCDNAAPYSKSMSLTRVANGAVFYCFRPVCNAKGLVNINGKATRSKGGIKHDSFNPYFNYTYELIPRGLSLWRNQGVMYNPTLDTWAFPVYDWTGEQFGWVDRSYTGRVPKAINYLDPSCPKVHFPRGFDRMSEYCVIVEDIPSSIAVNMYAPCCSVLGTSFSKEVLEALQGKFKRIYLALDADATRKAISLKRVLRTLFDVRVIMLNKDPKDMSPEELELHFGELE